MEKTLKNIHGIIVYYGLLILIMISWSSQTSAPFIVLRMLYFMLAVLPPIIHARQFMLPVLVTFSTLSYYGFAYSYFPTATYLYSLVSAIYLFYITTNNIKRKNNLNIPTVFLAFFFLTLFSDLVLSHYLASINYIFFTVLMCMTQIKKDDKQFFRFLQYSFIVYAFILCVFYLVFRDLFVDSYRDSGLDQAGWTDANYFGTVIGLGLVTAFIRLVRGLGLSSFEKIFLIVLLIIGALTLVMVASRGAVLAVGTSLVFFLMLSRIKTSYKILYTTVLVIGLYYLFSSSYAELLLYRVDAEVSSGEITGTNRTIIWAAKLNAFFQDGNIINWFLGMGFNGGFHLVVKDGLAFHNDFIAMFVDYGLIGLLLYLAMMFYPIKIASKEYKKDVAAGIIYLLVCGFSLEPLNAGRLPYWAFYVMWLYLAQHREINKSNYLL